MCSAARSCVCPRLPCLRNSVFSGVLRFVFLLLVSTALPCASIAVSPRLRQLSFSVCLLACPCRRLRAAQATKGREGVFTVFEDQWTAFESAHREKRQKLRTSTDKASLPHAASQRTRF